MKIAVLTNLKKDKELAVTKAVIGSAAKAGAEILLPDSLLNSGLEASFLNRDMLFSNADILITVGGDGTIIHAATKAGRHSLPLLGINCGNVGFIAELEKNELDLMEKIFSGDYRTEERSMLEISVRGRKYLCFNDAVITHGTVAKITEITLSRSGKEIASYRADGIIAATPTGSTAYNLSAGGPIIEPTASCITVTPICSHTLGARTVVFSDSKPLTAICKTEGAYLTLDGEQSIPLAAGDEVTVSVSDKMVKLIRLKDTEFFEVLNSKLNGRKNSNLSK